MTIRALEHDEFPSRSDRGDRTCVHCSLVQSVGRMGDAPLLAFFKLRRPRKFRRAKRSATKGAHKTNGSIVRDTELTTPATITSILCSPCVRAKCSRPVPRFHSSPVLHSLHSSSSYLPTQPSQVLSYSEAMLHSKHCPSLSVIGMCADDTLTGTLTGKLPLYGSDGSHSWVCESVPRRVRLGPPHPRGRMGGLGGRSQ